MTVKVTTFKNGRIFSDGDRQDVHHVEVYQGNRVVNFGICYGREALELYMETTKQDFHPSEITRIIK